MSKLRTRIRARRCLHVLAGPSRYDREAENRVVSDAIPQGISENALTMRLLASLRLPLYADNALLGVGLLLADLGPELAARVLDAAVDAVREQADATSEPPLQ